MEQARTACKYDLFIWQRCDVEDVAKCVILHRELLLQFQAEDLYTPAAVAGPKTVVDQAHALAVESEPVKVRLRQRLAFDVGYERDVKGRGCWFHYSRCFHEAFLAAR